MNPTVLAALIGAVASIIVNLLNNWQQSKRRVVEEARKEEKLNARLNDIDRTLKENNHKLDIHNGYADKIGSIQTDIAFIKGKLEKE